MLSEGNFIVDDRDGGRPVGLPVSRLWPWSESIGGLIWILRQHCAIVTSVRRISFEVRIGLGISL